MTVPYGIPLYEIMLGRNGYRQSHTPFTQTLPTGRRMFDLMACGPLFKGT